MKLGMSFDLFTTDESVHSNVWMATNMSGISVLVSDTKEKERDSVHSLRALEPSGGCRKVNRYIIVQYKECYKGDLKQRHITAFKISLSL